jgi:hypothetical protein
VRKVILYGICKDDGITKDESTLEVDLKKRLHAR